ncbi:GNAT family acetyltransferase [Kocuria dechangensis]|uniref:GNAT family acetyltransferase n=1 Tax=Kocuria dechangensis TaxID=1176249 RepID=A0A917GKQ2_9MICC|nr:GNAT family N-acetyltransferase [Kocuria dechangensis]GGG49299.1 GNAT family acetyltransferase [Kocuria dechangensis]
MTEDLEALRPAPVLETERLLIRPFTAEELDAVAAGEPAEHFAAGFPAAEDMDFARESLLAGGYFFTESVYARMAIVEKETGEIVGTAGFVGPPIDDELEVVGSLTADRRNRGYAQEGLDALLRVAFADAAVHGVRASVPGDNTPAEQVLIALGFVQRETPGLETDYFLPRPA